MPHLAALGAFDATAAARPNNLVYGLFSSVGITTVYDAGMSSFEAEALEALADMDRRGLLPFRVVASHQIQHPDQVASAIERFAELRSTFDGDRLHMGMIKIHNDGTTEARTAAYLEPYTDVPSSSGAVLLEPSVLNPFVVAIDRAGIDVHIHAIGDRAVREALDAIALARAENPDADTRHTLAHVEQITDADVPRFAALDVTAQTTPYWYSSDYAGQELVIGPERMHAPLPPPGAHRVRSARDLRQRLPRHGGGAPVHESPLEHRSGCHAPGHRRPERADPGRCRRADERGGHGAWLHPRRGPPAPHGRQVGSIEVGKRADLVVLAGNIFELPLHEIHQTGVDATMVDGEVVSGSLP
jgi:predicted amidohydrolase YtcJ